MKLKQDTHEFIESEGYNFKLDKAKNMLIRLIDIKKLYNFKDIGDRFPRS